MNYRKLHDRIVDSVAQSLHYFEKQSEIDLTKAKASDITNMCEGGIQRYMNEPIFRAKVQSMVAAILGAVRECDAVGPPTEGGQWISTKDRLPNDGTVCLAYNQSLGMTETITYWYNFVDNQPSAYFLREYSHWMPLPSPPGSEVGG